MIDRLLAIGSAFDWISPLVADILDVVNGPSHTFLFSSMNGRSGHEIVRLLREHGVSPWGVMIVNDTLMITVRAGQAHWANYILARSGIAPDNPVMASANGGARARQGRREKKRPAYWS